MTSGLLVLLGLALLAVGANLLVRGASRLALSLGLTPLVVGLTVVAFGTSAPEVAVSVGAALKGQTDIAVGNVVGSNILNVLLILGVSALILPLVVDRQIIRQEVPVMIGATVLLMVLAADGRLSVPEGVALVALMVAYTVFLIVQARKAGGAAGGAAAAPAPVPVPVPVPASTGAPEPAAAAAARGAASGWLAPVALVAAGLVLLVLGSDRLVEGAVGLARAFGMSEVVIGLTIVAAGTSTPELAASIAAALRGERDIAVGNVIGSNIFNILGCLGLAASVSAAGLSVAPSILRFDIWVMLAAALACLPVFLSGREIARWEGGLFVGYMAAYVAYLVLAHQAHDVLPVFSSTMMSFVAPLTVVTLVVMLLPRPARP